MTTQTELGITAIKQYSGQQQVQRKVVVNVPGKHFPSLQAAEQKAFYPGTCVEYAERHKFDRHLMAWGQAHTGPGLRFVCESDAIDDPDHKGFWTTLGLWNRWRHETYKDDRKAELQFLDELPTAEATAPKEKPKEKQPPEIKGWFDVVGEGTHTIEGSGKMAGTTKPCKFYACKTPGCHRGPARPIKIVGTDTGQLFSHLDQCNPNLAQKLRVGSSRSRLQQALDGEVYEEFTFDEALPHHCRFVEKCFRGLDHFYETRADNGLLEWGQGFDRRATLPCAETCNKILEVRRRRPRTLTLLPCTLPRAVPLRLTRSWSTRRLRR